MPRQSRDGPRWLHADAQLSQRLCVVQTRLEALAKTVKMQQIMDRKGATASNLLSLDNVKQMAIYQDRMQTFLAPFLHRGRRAPS